MTFPYPRYVHQTPEWPHYTWDDSVLAATLARIHFKRGVIVTAMASLGFDVRQETVLAVLVQDVTTSSAIEGAHLDALEVRSSIARRLGMDAGGLPVAGRDVEGVVEMMLDATTRFDAPLDSERLFGWHAALFPTGRSGMSRIRVGEWRDDAGGPMQVVSGPLGREKVHFEAPAAERVPAEMTHFLDWFEAVDGPASIDPVLKAAVAHLWFLTIHPLDDGNGRIARALTDLLLARADGTAQRFYSMSAQIQQARSGYYAVLERTQRDAMDITDWLVWFLARLDIALTQAEAVVRLVRSRQAFWDRYSQDGLNERQLKVVNMLFEGFFGKLKTAKYASITKTSPATAQRDLSDLVEKGILKVDLVGAGRSTAYLLAIAEQTDGWTSID